MLISAEQSCSRPRSVVGYVSQLERGVNVADRRDAEGASKDCFIVVRFVFCYMGAEDEVIAGLEVIGIVFHKGVAAGEAAAHGLHGADEGGCFPVPFAGEAIAAAHEALGGDAGELGHAVEVFEGIGEA